MVSPLGPDIGFDKKWRGSNNGGCASNQSTGGQEIWESATEYRVAPIKRCKRKFKPMETRPLSTSVIAGMNRCVTSTGFITLRALSKIISSDQ